LNGKATLFWENAWLTDKPLCTIHPIIYEWCLDKNISMYEVIEKSGRLDFDRWLPPALFENWMKVLEETYSYHFEN
jgi:hypothetical protein